METGMSQISWLHKRLKLSALKEDLKVIIFVFFDWKKINLIIQVDPRNLENECDSPTYRNVKIHNSGRTEGLIRLNTEYFPNREKDTLVTILPKNSNWNQILDTNWKEKHTTAILN